ncbi:MAG: hypothetical protein IIW35_04245 [Bacteroidaceae bacterium]|nr:hypothetical protein [Bacteroidaceae bacterium]
MKQFFSLFAIAILCSVAMLFSCTEKDDDIKTATPGTYFIESVIEAQKQSPVNEAQKKSVDQNINSELPRGLVSSNNDFDLIYDPDYIYFHIVGSEETVKIPVYKQACTHTPANRDCNCFRYKLVVYEDGSATVTPMLEDGTLLSTSLSIPAGAKCYFSSIPENVIEKPASSISTSDNIIYYERDSYFNKEIYRSSSEYTVYELAEDMDMLIMNRTCACFNLVGFFYDGEKMASTPAGYVTLSDAEFENIMGTSPSEWYIKIYIGGKDFSSKYDIGAKESIGEFDGGYYANSGGFKQFSKEYHGYGSHFLECFGYYTKFGNNLFSPVRGDKPVDVYILVKHWEGDGKPTAEWLASDDDALYTRMNITGNIYPVNNCFYILGLMMDVHQFKIAWDRASSELNKIPGRSKNELRYFSLPDAKVICEVY